MGPLCEKCEVVVVFGTNWSNIQQLILRKDVFLELMCNFCGDLDIICDISSVVNLCLFVQWTNFWENFF